MTIADILRASAKYGSQRFTAWLAFVMVWECVFFHGTELIRPEREPGDAGGLTYAGVDSASHPDFPFKSTTAEAVAAVYWEHYWVPSWAEQLAWPVGEVVANFAVNMGLGRSISMLQTAINQIPGGGSTVVDSEMGTNTLKASRFEDPLKLADLIEDVADARYRGIVIARPSQKKFLQGWLNRDDSLELWWQKQLSPPEVA